MGELLVDEFFWQTFCFVLWAGVVNVFFRSVCRLMERPLSSVFLHVQVLPPFSLSRYFSLSFFVWFFRFPRAASLSDWSEEISPWMKGQL